MQTNSESVTVQIYTANGPATEVEAKFGSEYFEREKGKTSAAGVGKHTTVSTQTQTGLEQSSTSKQRPDGLCGCDWLQEVSVTVRKFQSTSISCER